MASIDKSTSFLKPGNRWIVKSGKKVGQIKKGSTTPNTSLTGRASTTSSGVKATPKPPKATPKPPKPTTPQRTLVRIPKEPTTLQKASSATQGIRTRARVLTGAGRQDGPNTSKPASARAAVTAVAARAKANASNAASSVRKAVTSKVVRAVTRARGAKFTATNSARRGLANVKKVANTKRTVTNSKSIAANKIFNSLTGSKTSALRKRRMAAQAPKKALNAVGKAASRWGSAAQKAAIKKLADFNRGKKRAGKAVTRKAVKYGLRSGARYGGNSGK